MRSKPLRCACAISTSARAFALRRPRRTARRRSIYRCRGRCLGGGRVAAQGHGPYRHHLPAVPARPAPASAEAAAHVRRGRAGDGGEPGRLWGARVRRRWLSGFGLRESLVVGAAVMFSSTIIGLKLLPATVLLHHQRMGEIVSILLLQDPIAIVILLLLQGWGRAGLSATDGVLLAISPAGRDCVCISDGTLCAAQVVWRVSIRSGTLSFWLPSIGAWAWPRSPALDYPVYEIGAFIAGEAIAAAGPIALYIAESLRSL